MSEHLATCYVLHGKQDVRPERRSVAALPSGHVLVNVRRMGICGSDLHYFQDGHIGTFVPSRPFVLGHEGAGEVAAVAPDVSTLPPGTRIAIEPSRPCRSCRYCMSGRYNLCPHMKHLGSAATDPPIDGVFTDWIVVPASSCHQVPETLDDATAALIEPLSIAIHAVRQAGEIYGAAVLVTGGGAIGQLLLAVARAFGAGKLALSDPVERRRSFARDNAADAVFDPVDSAMTAQALDFTDGGFDLVFEASGVPHALRQALQLMRSGGTIVQVGSLPGGFELPVDLVMKRELRLVGSFRTANVFPMAIDLAASGRMDLRRLVTHTFPLHEFDTAIRLASAREEALKVQLAIDAD